MPTMKQLDVDLLHLDLHNFRTIAQQNETHAINTMISISPDRFWALLDSLLEDGYHATENIILLEAGEKFTVKEGNRRIAALKIILGKTKSIDIPDSIRQKISNIKGDWKEENKRVPCSIYKASESQKVDKTISLIHAKSEKAGRDQWTAVARARHNRDQKSQSERGLDLLEKYHCRIDKIFIDKFLYSKLTETVVPHIAVFLNDVQRKNTAKKNEYGINATFLPGHFKGYTVKLNPLDGVYYCDIRPNMLTEAILKDHIKTFDHLVCTDIWSFL